MCEGKNLQHSKSLQHWRDVIRRLKGCTPPPRDGPTLGLDSSVHYSVTAKVRRSYHSFLKSVGIFYSERIGFVPNRKRPLQLTMVAKSVEMGEKDRPSSSSGGTNF